MPNEPNRAAKRAVKQATKKKGAPRKRVETEADKVRRSREEAMRAAQDMEVTSLSEWNTASDEGSKVMLPSGKVVLARNPGMEPFIEEGLIPNSLLQIVDRLVTEGKGMTPKETKAMSLDPQMISDVMSLTNVCWTRCVINPRSALPPENAADREDSVLYTDKVDIEDKMFIFQWVVGGTRDLERFREQQAAVVASLENVDSVQPETE